MTMGHQTGMRVRIKLDRPHDKHSLSIIRISVFGCHAFQCVEPRWFSARLSCHRPTPHLHRAPMPIISDKRFAAACFLPVLIPIQIINGRSDRRSDTISARSNQIQSLLLIEVSRTTDVLPHQIMAKPLFEKRLYIAKKDNWQNKQQ